jgi:hypothetical protein
MKILLWILFAYGSCNVLIYGSNFQWWRSLLSNLGQGPYSLHKLFTCMMCLPTWAGFFMSFMGQKFLNIDTPSTMYGVENFWVAVFIDGLITTGSVWLLHTLQEAFERAFNNGGE